MPAQKVPHMKDVGWGDNRVVHRIIMDELFEASKKQNPGEVSDLTGVLVVVPWEALNFVAFQDVSEEGLPHKFFSHEIHCCLDILPAMLRCHAASNTDANAGCLSGNSFR